MAEKLTSSEERNARKVSKDMDEAWRIHSNPTKYPREKVVNAAEFLCNQVNNFITAGKLGTVDPETLKQVFTGIYHLRTDTTTESSNK